MIRIALLGPLVLISACAAPSLSSGDRVQPLPGSSPELPDLDGTSHWVLSGDSATVLVFWATWCAPCRRELPDLARAHSAQGTRARFFGVLSGEDRQVDTAKARELLGRAGVTYPQLRDREGSLARQFAVTKTPTILVLGPEGQLRYRGTGLPEAWEPLLR